uniref:Cilia and flagella associated protein 57 n=1 Tax=Sphaeramia orbicularis TaxID=375764 RepID=A0A673AT46_9TELE
MSTVVAQPHFMFGLRSGVTNNVCFCDEQTVVFPSGNNCVCYNNVQKNQKFIPGSDRSRGMTALAISANRRYLAVSECGDRATITVFDLQHEQGRKRKVLTAGDVQVQEFGCMAFSPDSKYLIGQTSGPDWVLIFWLWEKHKVLAMVTTTTSNNPITQVSFNPYNNMQLCVSGSGVFKPFRYAEGTLRQSSFPKVESVNFLCHTWVTEERVIAGTDTGRLLVFESGDLRREISLSNPVEGDSSAPRVTAILAFSRGFMCSMGPGTVYLFEKTKEDSYRKIKDILIPAELCGNEMNPTEYQEIHSMCISPAQETLVISTDGGQMYAVSLSSVEKSKEEQLHFEFLSQSFHSKSITGLSICIRKPLIATSSLDRSVRIWNYETKELELYKEFQEEAHSVALHPTGLFMLVGFSDKLRLMNLLIDDIRTFKEFTVRSCRECAFSHGGHMFAAVSGNVIHIYSTTSFENILNLKGHNGKVRGIEWSQDDSRLVSCGMDGAVYEWNTWTGKRESECVLNSCSYTGVAFSSDYKTIVAVGTDLTLKEIQDCQVLREVPADDVAHNAVTTSRTGRVVFTGTSSGTIRAVKYPLPMQKDWIMYQAHCAPVTKMAITFDEQFLLTVSEDGCLLMSKIVDKEGRGLKTNKQIIHTEEILVTKSDLEEKNQNMMELKMRLEELQMENEYQLRLKDITYNEKIKELSDKFSQQIKDLEAAQQALKTEMEKQEREHHDRSTSYSQKLIVEHERFIDLQQKCQRIQENYEERLKDAAESKSRALEELTELYETKLRDKTEILAQCQEEAKQKTCEFKETIKQMEENEKRTIHDIQTKYEQKLNAEKETNLSLKGQTDIMAQKFYSLQRQIDDRGADINKLKQERQRLLGLIRSMESDIEDLKRKISGLERTNQDKVNEMRVSDLKKKNMELEKLKFVLDFQLNELKNKIEPQQDDISEMKERIQQLEEELVNLDKSNTHLKLSVSDLKLKLRTREKEMHKEMQKVKTQLQRLKSDLHDCVGVIQEPKKLKECVKMIHARYVQQTDVVKEIQEAFCRQREHLEKTVTSLKTRLEKSAEEHEKTYVKIMKENVTLITEINELRKELRSVRSQAKEYKAQLIVSKKSRQSRPSSEEGPKKEPSHEEAT